MVRCSLRWFGGLLKTVTWGEKEVLKGVQLHSGPAVHGRDEEEDIKAELSWSHL